MRSVIQRVKQASVVVDGATIGAIDQGLVALVGIASDDTETQIRQTIDKLVNLRVFEDHEGRMNRSVQEISGGLLLVPNFTVMAACSKGRRPSFDPAMRPDLARAMFDDLVAYAKSVDPNVQTGSFGADMKVNITNDGPVTLIFETSP